jgi:hypothetical protein
MKHQFLRYGMLLLCFPGLLWAGAVDRYDVVWTSPGHDSSASMPLGNGDIGLNLWVEEDGDLLFYISKTDAWSENARLLKVGRLRVALSPNPFVKGAPFRQVLKLGEGEIEIEACPPPTSTLVHVWVDANRPVIRVEAESKQEFRMRAELEIWRTATRELSGKEADSAYGMEEGPEPVLSYPDTVVPNLPNRIVWFHRNEHTIWPLTMKLQGLETVAGKLSDPLLNRTFGGLVEGDGFKTVNATTLTSAATGHRHRIAVHVLTSQAPTADNWLAQLEKQRQATDAEDFARARERHLRWWREFWDRSWIRAEGTPQAETVTRGYTLQRFIAACAGRGAFPIKFNGSIFTVEAREPGENYDADYRRWGGPYWFQNTRLIYWPMLASGDFDLMAPLFRMYRDALPLANMRTPIYFGHEGAFFPETMYSWGAYANTNYGWSRIGKHVSQVDNTYIHYYWQGGIELTAMMLDYYDYTHDESFARQTLLPFAESVIQFYDRHYPRDAGGKILFMPAGALETWHEAVNPMPEIAGLRAVLPRLAALPAASGEQKTAWKSLAGKLPPIPVADRNGEQVLAAAQQLIGPIRNSENPELYAVFPYHLYGVGKPSLPLARRTFDQRRVKGTGGWYPDAILAACLGLADTAALFTTKNFSSVNHGSRFPAFWGPNFDWVPDQDNGSVAMIALESMLIQTDGRRIFVLPAWPSGWDVNFKLHAPGNTTVEGVYRHGRVERLDVRPAARKADVTIISKQ